MTLVMSVFTFIVLWWISLVMLSSVGTSVRKKMLGACVLSAMMTAILALAIHFELVPLKHVY